MAGADPYANATRPPAAVLRGCREIARQALTASAQAGGGSREAEALSGLLTEVLGRHEFERCACKTYPRTVDLICQHAQDLATAIAGF